MNRIIVLNVFVGFFTCVLPVFALVTPTKSPSKPPVAPAKNVVSAPQKTPVASPPMDMTGTGGVATLGVQGSAVMATGITPGAAGIQPKPVVTEVMAKSLVFQNKYKEVNAKRTIAEKFAGVQELLFLVDAGTLQPDKNNLTSLINNFFAQHGVMKKGELVNLAYLLKACSDNQFLLAPNQRPVMRQWGEMVGKSVELVEANKSLIDSLKNQINKAKTNFVGALAAATYAVNLLATKLPVTELNKHNKQGLLALLRQNISTFYNSRANKSVSDIQALNNFFTIAKKRADLQDVIRKGWAETLALDASLMNARAQETMSARIVAWNDVADIIKASTDRYEKGIFVDDLTTFFSHRTERAARELDAFKKLIAKLQSANFKKNKIFERSDFARFNSWEMSLNATLAMRLAQEDKPVLQMVKSLSDSLSLIAQAGTEEKKIFVQVISNLFLQRGSMVQAELNTVKQLFEKIKKTSGLLAANQVAVLNAWMGELAQAQFITSGSNTYFDAMLTDATAAKDAKKFIKMVDLFTSKTSATSRSAFVNGLNTLFVARKTLDPNVLMNLFNKVDAKRIEQSPLLSNAQQSVLKQWLQIINTEAPAAVTQR